VQERTEIDVVDRPPFFRAHRHRVRPHRHPLAPVTGDMRDHRGTQGAQEGALPVKSTAAQENDAGIERQAGDPSGVRQRHLAAQRRRRFERHDRSFGQGPVVVPRAAGQARPIGDEGDPSALRECVLQRREILRRLRMAQRGRRIERTRGETLGYEALRHLQKETRRLAAQDPPPARWELHSEPDFKPVTAKQDRRAIEHALAVPFDRHRRAALSPGFIEPATNPAAGEVA
jgi:hypothetical protein